MNDLAGPSKTFQQLNQRAFDVLFVASQALLSLSNPAKCEQNQQWFMRRALATCPPEFNLTELLKEFVAFHRGEPMAGSDGRLSRRSGP